MTPTNPYRGIAKTTPELKLRFNLDVDKRDVATINSVLVQHGLLQALLNTTIKQYANYITANALSFTDRDAFLARCTTHWPIGPGLGDNDGGRVEGVHEAPKGEVRRDVCDCGGVQAPVKSSKPRKGLRKGKGAK